MEYKQVTMNTVRSPIKRSSTLKVTSAGETSTSQPDLSNINELYSENVSLRKRKVPESDFAHQFSVFKNEFRKEIAEIIQESAKNQSENIKTISENISSINEKFKNMQTITEQLVAENKNLKTQILSLKDTVIENESRITSLQTEFQQLKSNAISTGMQPISQTASEKIFEEFQDRVLRSKNIVIVGVAEKYITNMNERRARDMNEVTNILNTIYPNCPRTDIVQRVGKYDPKKIRPLKVSFPS